MSTIPGSTLAAMAAAAGFADVEPPEPGNPDPDPDPEPDPDPDPDPGTVNGSPGAVGAVGWGRLRALSVGRTPCRLTTLPIPIPMTSPTAAMTDVATNTDRESRPTGECGTGVWATGAGSHRSQGGGAASHSGGVVGGNWSLIEGSWISDLAGSSNSLQPSKRNQPH
jgi:hypothetical protein